MSVYKIILFVVDMNGKYCVKCILFLKAHLHLVEKGAIGIGIKFSSAGKVVLVRKLLPISISRRFSHAGQF